MTTATKVPTHIPSRVPGEGPMPFVDLDAHQKDMARRRAEREAKKDVLRQCIDPRAAKRYELKKPMYVYTITASWFGSGPDGPGQHGPFTRKIVSQNEDSAWAMFCDKIDRWPSRRDADLEIKRGKQVSQEEAEAVITCQDYGTEDGGPVRRYEDQGQRKTKK